MTKTPGLTSLWDLEGRWTLSRIIAHKNGRSDHLTGCSTFRRDGDRLLQDDAGLLTVKGQTLEAKQSYIWIAKGDGLAVMFSDERPFHTIPLRTATPKAEHFCAPDTYVVEYNFADWPKWSAVWTVQGPRKDYRMTSHLFRAD